ncbi:MAG: FHA domain-containing protein [Phycisphaerae bacterium]|nr:FHA domain-containing protein [Phycisphaerae bacterium]
MDVSLVMFRDTGEPRAFHLDPGQTTIGRREDCDLRIPLGEISRKHAVIIVGDKRVTVRDLGSANGTYVNNVRISEQDLEPGDHIVLGQVVFTIQIDGKPADVRPARTRLEARLPKEEQAQVFQKRKDSPAEDEDDLDITFGEADDDPISALEAMASSDETAQIDLDDSQYKIDDDQP